MSLDLIWLLALEGALKQLKHGAAQATTGNKPVKIKNSANQKDQSFWHFNQEKADECARKHVWRTFPCL